MVRKYTTVVNPRGGALLRERVASRSTWRQSFAQAVPVGVCWDGTAEQFYPFYEAVARALKSLDPTIQVGGPAAVLAGTPGPWHRSFQRDDRRHVIWHFSDPGILFGDHEILRVQDIQPAVHQ